MTGAFCPHLGTCGGCTRADYPSDTYRAAKRQRLIDALARAGLADTHVAEMIDVPLGRRRRMDFAVARQQGRVVLGLHRKQSRDIVDLAECPLAVAPIAALLAPLRALFARLEGFRRTASAIVAATETGLDLVLTLDAALSNADRTRLVAFAEDENLARISLGDEPVVMRRTPVLHFGAIPVTPPAAGFLQPSAEGEAAIRTAVLAGLPEKFSRKSRIVELYAGAGTLTFALAEKAPVIAAEGSAPAIAALDRAARAAGLVPRITATQRDLAKRPFLAKDLAGTATVVLDPPYDGARTQTAQIAAARIPRIVYVSCNPVALARDASILAKSGYHAVSAIPIDQFPASDHLESVVTFARN